MGWVGLGQLFGGLGWVDENRPTDNSELYMRQKHRAVSLRQQIYVYLEVVPFSLSAVSDVVTLISLTRLLDPLSVPVCGTSFVQHLEQLSQVHASASYARRRPLCIHYVPLSRCLSRANIDSFAGRASPLHTCSGGGII